MIVLEVYFYLVMAFTSIILPPILHIMATFFSRKRPAANETSSQPLKCRRIDHEQPLNHFERLSREIREEIYAVAWEDTNTCFGLGFLEVSILYEGSFGLYAPKTTGLPEWLLTNSTFLKEGIEQLQRGASLVLEPSSMHKYAGQGVNLRRSKLLDPSKLRTIIIHCPQNATFDLAHQGNILQYKNCYKYAIGGMGLWIQKSNSNLKTCKVVIWGGGALKRQYTNPMPFWNMIGRHGYQGFEKVVLEIEDHLGSEYDYDSSASKWQGDLRALAKLLFGGDPKEKKWMDLDAKTGEIVDHLVLER